MSSDQRSRPEGGPGHGGDAAHVGVSGPRSTAAERNAEVAGRDCREDQGCSQPQWAKAEIPNAIARNSNVRPTMTAMPNGTTDIRVSATANVTG